MSISLEVVPGDFSVCRYPPNEPFTMPRSAGFVVAARSENELSVVSEASLVPDDVTAEHGWKCLRVVGRIPFETVGLLRDLVSPLAAADISVFAVSTFDTDYLLVKAPLFGDALDLLEASGFEFRV